MSKIDEIKQNLNSLRAYFAVVILLMVTVGSGLVSSYRLKQFDVLFWSGFFIEFSLLVLSFVIIHKIKTKTKEIGDL